MKTLTLTLIPLDERPVNTRYSQMLGAIGGVEILLPPVAIRGLQRVPADRDAVMDWLQEAAARSDACLVSCDFLGFGNLINARISHDSAADILARLRPLAEINTHCPVHAFSLITRVSNADDAVEEPEYWALWGTKFYRYAHLSHQLESGALTELDELTALENSLPSALKIDWLARRLRNHTVNLGLLDMTVRGQITSLLLTSDDTGAFGLPSRERDWLRGWPRLIGTALSDRVQMHPGADEVGSALVAKLLTRHTGHSPRVWPIYSMSGDEEIVAPYEDRPVRETVIGQLHACGCTLAVSPDDCDIILGVATPSPRRTDYNPDFINDDRVTRAGSYRAFLSQLTHWQTIKPVALADVAYPNGSDPLLTELLFSENTKFAPGQLCAYGAWNTAGNTLGVVIAQAVCAGQIGQNSGRTEAQRTFLTHRFLEDWGYQSIVRREARAEAERLWGRREPDPASHDEQQALCVFIETRLSALLETLQSRGIGQDLTVLPGSVHLPWRRTFEVDFELIRKDKREKS